MSDRSLAGLLTNLDLHSVHLPSSLLTSGFMEEYTKTYSSGGCAGLSPASLFHPYGHRKIIFSILKITYRQYNRRAILVVAAISVCKLTSLGVYEKMCMKDHLV